MTTIPYPFALDDIDACALAFADCAARQGPPKTSRIVDLEHRGEVWRVQAVRVSPPAAGTEEEGTG